MSAIGGKAGGLPASTYTTAKKVFGFVGGRTRTRTLDPLIKSQLSSLDLIVCFFKPNTKARVSGQKLRTIFQTGALWRELPYRNRSLCWRPLCWQ
jgi:hypothetical protein